MRMVGDHVSDISQGMIMYENMIKFTGKSQDKGSETYGGQLK